MVGVVGSALASVGFGITYFASNIWIVFITVGFLTGTGLGLLYLPAIVCVGHYFDKKRSLAMGFAVCGSGVGKSERKLVDVYYLYNYRISTNKRAPDFQLHAYSLIWIIKMTDCCVREG